MAPRPSVTRGVLLPIGEFSRRCRLPISTLRYYHAVGLLQPERIDPASGYRYYSTTQLAVAGLIAELRRLAIAPDVIARVIRGGDDAAAALEATRHRLRRELDERAAALQALDRLAGEVADPAGTIIGLEPRCAALLAARTGQVRAEHAAADVRRLIASLRRELRRGGHIPSGPFGAVFPLDLDLDPMPATVFAPITPGDIAPADVETLRLEPGTTAVALHRGGPSSIWATYGALLDWVAEHDLTATGPVVEEYRGDPGAVEVIITIPVTA